jgi:hypothetical protein
MWLIGSQRSTTREGYRTLDSVSIAITGIQ